MAKKWGLTMFGRGESNAGQGASRPAGTPEEPIGRGHPLPPPGTPLPRPAKVNVKKNSVSIPKRKPVPTSPQDHEPSEETAKHPTSRSPFPRRKPVIGEDGAADRSDELLVIEAPYDSAPNSPADFAPDQGLAGRGMVVEGAQPGAQGDSEVKTRQSQVKEQDGTLSQPSAVHRRDTGQSKLSGLPVANGLLLRELE
jgi:hypothetical protein